MSCKLAVQRSQLEVILVTCKHSQLYSLIPNKFLQKDFQKKHFVQNETLKKYEL